MFSLILFSMACGLAVGLMLLLVCATLYAGLLSKGRWVTFFLVWWGLVPGRLCQHNFKHNMLSVLVRIVLE